MMVLRWVPPSQANPCPHTTGPQPTRPLNCREKVAKAKRLQERIVLLGVGHQDIKELVELERAVAIAVHHLKSSAVPRGLVLLVTVDHLAAFAAPLVDFPRHRTAQVVTQFLVFFSPTRSAPPAPPSPGAPSVPLPPSK